MSSFIAVINNEITAIKLPNVGSVFLRVGTVVFAILTCIYFTFSTYMDVFVELDICAVIFTIIQTHFLFYSSMMLDDRHYIITRFGAMHLVAANLITWFQFLFFKYQTTQRNIATLNTKGELPIIYKSQIYTGDDCLGIECILGSFTKIFYTAVIEYSMIASAVMFINGVGAAACLFALWRLRDFQYHNSSICKNANHANQELLDSILLAIGLFGEISFSISGLVGLSTTRKWQELSFILAFAHIFRIIQSLTQCFLICIASKFRNQNPDKQPGMQTITFLIVVNISMFIMNLLASDKAGTCEEIMIFYGQENWVFLVRIFSPLTIFFRFHSSACFAEIWKKIYVT
uniref:Uncharacterized protein n=1 Tax=Panagrolaimus sp. PS1159 TaxID=55785 RepID=A0AC35FZ15_9BILA